MRWLAVVLALLLTGALLKGAAVQAGRADLSPEAWVGRLSLDAWSGSTAVLWFPDRESGALVPVERRVRANGPEPVLAELRAGPAPGRSLEPLVPEGADLTLVQFVPPDPAGGGGYAVLSAPGIRLEARHLEAFALSLGVERVGQAGGLEFRRPGPESRVFRMAGSHPVSLALPGPLSPQQALEALLALPGTAGAPAFPPGLRLRTLTVDGETARVGLDFSPELALLVESGLWNLSGQYMGIVYTLTEFPRIKQVRLQFSGLSPLALRNCRTPLAVPLRRPAPEASRALEVSR